MDKEYLYINGSSVSAGGGFEEYQYRQDIRDAYTKKGIELPQTQVECSFGYYIAKELNLTLINHSKSGGGIDRMIRTTYDWIRKNRIKSKKTIFILEPQTGIRLDWFVKEWNDYGVLNAHLNEKGKYPFTLVKDWFTDDNGEQNLWNQKYEDSINGFFENFYDETVYLRNELSKLIFFISYLNQKNIDYIISLPDFIPTDLQIELNNITPKNSNINSFLNSMNIWMYSLTNKILISDEINSNDNHIGFFGNKVIAKKLLDFINKRVLNYCLPYDSLSVQRTFLFNDLLLNRVTSESSIIDFIPFEGISIQSFSDTDYVKTFTTQLINHPSYQISKNNPKIPVVFFHEHEALDSFEYEIFEKTVSKILNIQSKKIILIDTNVINRSGVINLPLKSKIKQFEIPLFDSSVEKTKKFTFLNNKSQKIRFETFDKVLKNYENNITKLNEDSLVTYRNYKDENKGPSPDISEVSEYINTSGYYKFYNDYEFYKTINLPWVVDNFLIGGEYQKMFKQQNILYGQSYFSIVLETSWYYYDLDITYYDTKFLAISEKGLIPFCSNNLPFIIHDKRYYKQLESIGFDFSYLKTIFDIDYNKNTLAKNFNSIDKFLSYLKNNTLDKIKEDYDSVLYILEKNRDILEKIQSKDLDTETLDFIEKIKKEKYE